MLSVFFHVAYIIFQQDSKAQITAIHLIIGTLQRMQVFGSDNRDTLTHKATGVSDSYIHIYSSVDRDDKNLLTNVFFGLQYSAKLLKKPDQCRAVYACSHLFWVESEGGVQDGERYPHLIEEMSVSSEFSSNMQAFVRVVLCLKRALRIANAAQQMATAAKGSGGSVTLFVEILNKYKQYLLSH